MMREGRWLSPTYYYRRVTDIDLDYLAVSGIDTLLIDIDNTILPRDTGELTDELTAWAAALLGRGFKVCLVSNNEPEHVARIAGQLGLAMVHRALKPLGFGFRKAVAQLGSRLESSAVVGDQLFTDVLGGNLLGMTTILVEPLSSTDPAHTLVIRRIERRLLAGRHPLGGQG